MRGKICGARSQDTLFLAAPNRKRVRDSKLSEKLGPQESPPRHLTLNLNPKKNMLDFSNVLSSNRNGNHFSLHRNYHTTRPFSPILVPILRPCASNSGLEL